MVQRIRLRYTKRGRLRFTSHRDFQRAFERALRRADVPMAYSAGFTPHPKVSYANAAPTGVGSEAEYLEIALVRPRDPRELRRLLDESLPPGLDVMDAVEARTGGLAERLEASVWELRLDGVTPERARRAAEAFLAADTVEVQRTTKSGVRTFDCRAAVTRLDVTGADAEAGASTGTGAPTGPGTRADAGTGRDTDNTHTKNTNSTTTPAENDADEEAGTGTITGTDVRTTADTAAHPGPGDVTVVAAGTTDNADTAPRGADEPQERGCAILRLVVRHLTPAVRPDDVLSGLRAVADLAPPVPAAVTRLAQGPLDEETGMVTDPLALDRDAVAVPAGSAS